jgi:predicted ATP-grasp superfamily ATP-dependent carboligase
MKAKRRIKVLVTQSEMKHSLAIIRHLANQGYEVHALVREGRRSLARLSRYTARTYPINEELEESFIAKLLLLLKENSLDVLIPVGFPITEFVSRHADEIAQIAGLMCPEKNVCEMAGDKLQIVQLAQSLGIAVPRTYQVINLSELTAVGDVLGYPLVIKGRHESGRGIVAYAGNSSELGNNFEALCRRFDLKSPCEYPILQEYIPGWGCGFFAIYQKGVLKRIFMHKRIREFPVSGGASCCAESFFDDDLLVLGKTLLDKLSWHGVAMVECRFDMRSKRFTLIEVNAKFWGSLELALRAGADFVGDYVRGAMGEQLGFSQSFEKIRFQWPFDGDLLHAVGNPMAWRAVAKDFFNPSVAKDFHWTDPFPTLVKMYGSLRAVASACAKSYKVRPE